jgi:D-alanyl-D-alanine carboxypeptidase (penicillin-binding protein 5/6)
MKKSIALTLVLCLAFTLVTCSDSHDTQPATAVLTAISLPRQRDVAPVYTEVTENTVAGITATNAYVLNVDTKSVFYQKNSADHIAPASTVKMLTALTVMDYYSLDETITVGSEIGLISSDSSLAELHLGDTLTVKQLLVALLLPSGNDAAYTLAVNAGRRLADDYSSGARQAVEVFVDAMNQKAKDMGATSSNFANPDGYDTYGQYTTAFDLAQIAKACLDNEALSEIMGSYRINDIRGGQEVTYLNTNELLNPHSQYYYAKAVGLKTGSTGEAGSCLVSAAVINGQTYICVVMGSSEGGRFLDSLTVFSAIDPTISLPEEDIAAPAPGGLRRP